LDSGPFLSVLLQSIGVVMSVRKYKAGTVTGWR